MPKWCDLCFTKMEKEYKTDLGMQDRWGFMYRCPNCGNTHVPSSG